MIASHYASWEQAIMKSRDFWFMDYAHVHPTSSSLDKGGQHCPTASHTCWVTYALYSEFSCLHEY